MLKQWHCIRNELNQIQRLGEWPIPNPEINSDIDPSNYVVTGDITGPYVTNSTISIFIQSRNEKNEHVNHNDAVFKVRLVGTAMISVPVMSIGNGKYKAIINIQHAGEYLIEILLLTVEGTGTSPRFVVRRSNSYYVNKLIYNSEKVIRIVSDNRTHMKYKKCTRGDSKSGRWVSMTECRLPFCTISNQSTLDSLQINDPIGLNKDSVYVPDNCYYHLFSPQEVFKCFNRKNYVNLGFSGDSVGREQMQNIQMILSYYNPQMKMPKLKPSDKLENTLNNINLQWNHGPNKQDITMIHMSEPHVLASGGDMISIIQQQTLNLRNRVKSCRFAKAKCIVYINPQVQREIDHTSARLSSNNFYKHITPQRMSALTNALRKEAELQNVSILDGASITKGHWFGSWDGLHYSEYFSHYKKKMVIIHLFLAFKRTKVGIRVGLEGFQ